MPKALALDRAGAATTGTGPWAECASIDFVKPLLCENQHILSFCNFRGWEVLLVREMAHESHFASNNSGLKLILPSQGDRLTANDEAKAEPGMDAWMKNKFAMTVDLV